MQENNASSRKMLFFLTITAIFCGAQVMVVEVLGSKIIGPFFGASLFVWTSLITVTLLSLSAGYAAGGWLSDRRGHADYLFGIIFISGLLVLAIPYIKEPVIKACLPLGLRAGSLASASMLFAPSLILLGCVSPYIIKLAAREIRTLGRTVGLLYSLSTIGSVIGTILAGFVLIAYFSVTKIFLFTGFSLMAISILYFVFFRRQWAALLVLALPLIFPSPAPLVEKTLPSGTLVREIFRQDSFYGRVQVVDYDSPSLGSRELLLEGSVHDVADKATGDPLHVYFYLMRYIPEALRPGGSNCLVVGLGSGLLPMMFERSGIITDSVEIDPLVADVAGRYFGFNSKGTLYIQDARYHMIESRKSYDYIIMDVFNSDISVPSHLITLEAFELMKNRLSEGGVLAINVSGSLERDPFVTASIIKTLKELFTTVDIYLTSPLEKSKEFSNFIVTAYDSPRRYIDPTRLMGMPVHPVIRGQYVGIAGQRFEFPKDTKAMVLTDDYNPVDFHNIKLGEFVRGKILSNTDLDILL